MKFLAATLFASTLCLGACSNVDTSDIFDNPNIRIPEVNIPPVDSWKMPDTGEFGETVSENFREIKDGVWRQVEIAKMPEVQRVMVLKGSHMASSPASRNKNFDQWDPNRTYEWTVMLEDARLFTIRQSGPQFYQYESLVLFKKGLKLTLFHRPQSQMAPTVKPPEPY